MPHSVPHALATDSQPATPRSRHAEEASLYPSVLELLGFPVLSGARLLTPLEAAERARVTGVSVQEVPLEGFVRAGEFVMTTGVGVGKAISLSKVVEQITSAQAAAVAIAVGPHVHSIDDASIGAARRGGLCLIQLPWDLRFAEVIEEVLGHLLSRQTARLREAESVNRLFTEIVLSGGDMTRLRLAGETLLRRPLRIRDSWFALVAGDEGPDWRRQAEFAITTKNFRRGSLLVNLEAGELSEPEAEVARRAAAAAGLIFVLEDAALEGEERSHGEFLYALIGGWHGPRHRLEERAGQLGLNSAAGQVAMCLRLVGTGGKPLVAAGKAAVRKALEARRIPALVASHDDEIAIVFSLTSIPAVELVRTITGDARRLLAIIEPNVRILAGMGGAVPSLQEIPRSLREARTAARLAPIAAPSDSEIIEYQNLGAFPAIYEAVTGGDSDHAFRVLQNRVLGPVLDYEKASGLPLIATLRALFAANGHVSGAARDLGINRQSLLYRLERLRRLTGLDIATPEDRFALEVALRAYTIVEQVRLADA
jgi:purine catabolism regulator